jgi:hypothetical protein
MKAFGNKTLLRYVTSLSLLIAPLSAAYGDAVLTCTGTGVVNDGNSSVATNVSFEIEALEAESVVIVTLP